MRYLNNFLIVVKDSFTPGFKSIFLHEHFDQYLVNNNIFFEVFNKLINPPYKMESEYTFIFIYFVSFFVLISKIIFRKYDYLDFIFLVIILLFYLIDKNPEPRQHLGIIFYLIAQKFMILGRDGILLPQIIGNFMKQQNIYWA